MKRSCFAYQAGKCLALDPAPCAQPNGKPCPFYKTCRQQEAALRAVNEIIAAKPEVAQRYLAGKYYIGKMPWREKEGKRNDKQRTVPTVPPQPGDHGAAAAAG